MRSSLRLFVALLSTLALACGSSDSSGDGGAGGATSSSGGSGGSGTMGDGGGGAQAAGPLSTLGGFLQGDFDNFAQADQSSSVKRVERHVCTLPGRDQDPGVVWLYVEHVDLSSTPGQRDAYYTRVNEIREVDGAIVSRIYAFDSSFPLYTNAFQFNGERDGCLDPDLLASITDADLVYRDGCDVTFVPEADGLAFGASTAEGTCTFPGGYIVTSARIFQDGMDSTDTAHTNGGTSGEEYQFRRTASN